MKRILAALFFTLAVALPAAAQSVSKTTCTGAAYCILKGGNPGSLIDAYVTTGGTAGYLFTFNQALAPGNGPVSNGTAQSNYQDCVYVAANSTQGISTAGSVPESFSSGITIAFSTTGCGSYTGSIPQYLGGRAQ